MIPIGTLCIVKRACPTYAKYLGCVCEVIAHGQRLYDGRLICPDCNFIRLTDGFEILAEDNCLMPINPPGVRRRVDKPEPVTA